MNRIVLTTKAAKLADLCKSEGYDIETMMQLAILDSTCKGICVNPGCDFTNDVEPDQHRGYCGECDTNTVKSALVLAGLI